MMVTAKLKSVTELIVLVAVVLAAAVWLYFREGGDGLEGARGDASASDAAGASGGVRGVLVDGHLDQGIDGGVVSGFVSAGGRPVSGAGLSVLYLEAPGEKEAYSLALDVASGTDGTFRIGRLGPGRIQVLAEKEGFALAESEEVFLGSGMVQTGVDIRMSDAASITGVVVDTRGDPVAGALVRLFSARRHGPRRTLADGQGRFWFDKVPPGEFWLKARSKGHAPGKRLDGDVEAGAKAEVTVVLRPVAGIAGRAEDFGGRAVGGAAVFMCSPGTACSARPPAHSDASGAFWLAGPFEAERFEVWATHPRNGPSRKVMVDLGIEQPLVLRLTGPGGLAGRVVAGAGGEPVARFRVRIAGFRPEEGEFMPGGGFGSISVQDPEGWFAFDKLAPGTYSIEVLAPGYTSALVGGIRVAAGRRTDAGAVALDAGASVVGRVVDDTDGKPLANALVSAAGLGVRMARAVTGSRGEFELSRVPAQRLSINIGRKGYVTEIVSGVEAIPDGRHDIGTVRLKPAGDRDEHAFRYAGMGAKLAMRDERLFVMEAFEDSPASMAGLGPHAEILRVDGYEVAEIGLGRSVELIRGQAGTEFVLDVLLPGSPYPQTVRVERSSIVRR